MHHIGIGMWLCINVCANIRANIQNKLCLNWPVIYNQYYTNIDMWGLSKIPVTFWYVRTPCASPLRALARVRISAYPIHRMQNSSDFCMLQSKSNFLCKPQQKCEEFCGSGLAPRCHWRKCYYQTQIYEESFFVGNPFEGPGWTGGTCPGTILSCADLAPEALSVRLGFLTKHDIVDFLGKKNKKRAFYDQSTHPKEQFSIRHVTSLVNKQDTSWRQMLRPISKVTNVQGKKEGYDTNNQLDTYTVHDICTYI